MIKLKDLAEELGMKYQRVYKQYRKCCTVVKIKGDSYPIVIVKDEELELLLDRLGGQDEAPDNKEHYNDNVFNRSLHLYSRINCDYVPEIAIGDYDV